MKFGIFILGEKPPMLPGDEVYRRNLDQCRAADDMGYDTIWLGETTSRPTGRSPTRSSSVPQWLPRPSTPASVPPW